MERIAEDLADDIDQSLLDNDRRRTLSDDSVSHFNRSRGERQGRRQSVSSNFAGGRETRSKSHVYEGIERKLSVLDDASSSNGVTSNEVKEKVKEKIELNKGVRDMHFEIAFDTRLREKANILRGNDA